VLFAFRWYLVVQLFGLAALPLCVRLLRRLPDRGYGVAKPLGLLLAGWVFWLTTTFGWTHNTVGGILVAVAVLAVAGILVHLSNVSPSLSLTRWLRENWRVIVVTEGVFVLAFIAWCLVRAHMPRILTAGGEKWMEIAFLRAILRSDAFPPHDPWLSGFAISYYYFGYIIVAMVTRLAAVPPAIAFNLGIAALFALACTGAFSLVYNLVYGLDASNPKGLRRPLGFSLLGPLMVAVMGNLEGLLEVLHARGVGPAWFWQWLDVRSLNVAPPILAEGSWVPPRFMWWWQASRVLHDYTPWGAEQEVIDEFPAFSFILGDMHPHVLALPFVLLALALALNVYGKGSREYGVGSSRGGVGGLDWWEVLVYALCLGGLGFLNTWDFPIYLFIVVAAYALGSLHGTQHETHAFHVSRFTFHVSRFTFHALRVGLLFAVLLLGGIFLYLPFWVGFQSQAGGILVNLFNATRLPQFLVMFGPLAFIAVAFVVDSARRSGVGTRDVVRWTLTVLLVVLAALALVVGLFAALVWLGVISPQGPAAYLAAWLQGGPIPGLEDVPDARALISRSLLLRLVNPWTALGLVALIITVVLVLARDLRITRNTKHEGHEYEGEHETRSDETRNTNHTREHETNGTRRAQDEARNFDFALLLIATGALLTLGVEYVYLRDHFGVRMNTVFKFYFQAWVMWAVAGAYALADFAHRDTRWSRAVVVIAACLVAAGVIYPLLAVPTRAREYGGPPTLDGAAYLAEAYPEDYAAIAWLNEHVSGTPVILESPGAGFRAYVYEGRVSAHTGLPTLLGWGGHEHQWRGNYDEPGRREPDIETLYTSVNPAEVLTLLDRYGISYVYVGPLERTRYPAPGLTKFAGLMDVVYDSGSVTIYHRTMNNEQWTMNNEE
jgi:YYY domain-containing protein